MHEAIFLTGTDTNVGKTTVASWIALHTKCDYFKPIQTGPDIDSHTVKTLSGSFVHKEIYRYPEACSPHLAAQKQKNTIRPLSKLATGEKFVGNAEVQNRSVLLSVREDSSTESTYKLPHAVEFGKGSIDIDAIVLPYTKNKLLVEGAGGVMVPINDQYFIIDIIKKLSLPAIIVSRSSIGTINHTLLTISALRNKGITILGVIVNGILNPDNCLSIEKYGQIPILAQIPQIGDLNRSALQQIPMPQALGLLF